ncbi:MAG: flagellar biosynthesis protein FliQ [Anaerofustis sp.]
MDISSITDIMQATFVVIIKLAAPILLVSLVIGLIISIFQAASQIHEQTLTFVPKLIAIGVVLLVMGPWMMEVLSDFTKYIFDQIITMV